MDERILSRPVGRRDSATLHPRWNLTLTITLTRRGTVWQMTDYELARNLGGNLKQLEKQRDTGVAAAPGALKMSGDRVAQMKRQLVGQVMLRDYCHTGGPGNAT